VAAFAPPPPLGVVLEPPVVVAPPFALPPLPAGASLGVGEQASGTQQTAMTKGIDFQNLEVGLA
jgi:hypothetical protein